MILESRKRLRRDYAPLVTAVTLDVTTPNSPPNQVYDPETNSYNPDREITPLAIMPVVEADAIDGSWDLKKANIVIANMKWFVNGENIQGLPNWAEKFEIKTEGANRGEIVITKNIKTSEKVELHFEAVIPDYRKGINVPIKSKSILLSTVDSTDDTFALSLDCEQNIKYNVFLDKLLVYDYLSAKGVDAGNRSDALDSNSYLKEINAFVSKGGENIENGYTLHLYKVKSNLSLEEITENSHEINLELANNRFTLDLRLIRKADLILMVKSQGVEVARKGISVSRVYPPYKLEILSSVTMNATDIYHRNACSVSHKNRLIEIPELSLRMLWKTDTQRKENVEWNEGSRTFIELNKAGVGKVSGEDWMDIYIESEYKDIFTIANDTNDNEYTDNQGNVYIIN